MNAKDKEIIEDGGRVRVSLTMMDSRRPATFIEDASAATLKAHQTVLDAASSEGERKGLEAIKAGGGPATRDALEGARDAAYRNFEDNLSNAWKREG